MAKIERPRYMRPKKLAGGSTGYFWERPTWAKPPAERWGRTCPVDSEALGTDLAAAIGKADLLNGLLDEWRAGVVAKPAEGTVKALFAWYRGLSRFKDLGYRSRLDYHAAMDRLVAFQLKTTTLGQRRAAEIEAAHVDAVYRALIKTNGKRTATYAMQVGRRVWNEAIRHKKVKGPNPFARMGLSTKAEKGNRATSRAEYDAFRQQARAMGLQSMATAAALAFELVRRVSDVFGFEFPGEVPPAILWAEYVPGKRIGLRQGKTGDRQVIPLRGEPGRLKDGEHGPPWPGRLLYPELEAELARTPRVADHIVILEATGRRYKVDEASWRFERIRTAAGLPKEMTLTGFRHGGATELGDAGVDDIRAVSGHRTLQQTATYNKATERKARSAGERRRQHVGTRRNDVSE